MCQGQYTGQCQQYWIYSCHRQLNIIIQMWIRSLSKTLTSPSLQNFNNQTTNIYNLHFKFTTTSARASTKTTKKTYYQILQIPTSASMTNIKQNYLRLAKIYHPDVYKGKDKQRFQKIQQAYKTLSDKLKRIKYDQQMGLGRKFDKGAQQQYMNKGSQQPNPQKPKNPMQYQRQKQQSYEDLDEQFVKFFNKKPKTKFQQIRLNEQAQIRSMTQQQRVRRHFKQAYQKPDVLIKAKNMKQYDQVLNDQINQKNRMYEDSKKQQKKYQQRSSQKGIKKMKYKLIAVFTIVLVCSVPLINSFVTKYRLQKQEMDRLTALIQQMTYDLQQLKLRSRLKYQ